MIPSRVLLALLALASIIRPQFITAWQKTAARVVSAQTQPSPAQIASLEQEAAGNPENIEIRVRILRAYAAAEPLGLPAYRAARVRHIQFLIQANPAGDLAAATAYFVASHGSPYADPADHARVRAVWLSAADQHFNDSPVTLNVLRFLVIEDKKEAEDLFERLITARPAAVEIASHLGFFYAAGLVAADTMDGREVVSLPAGERAAWKEHCRTALERNLNPHVLLGAAAALPNMAMRRTGGGREYEALVKYAEELRRRADTANAGVLSAKAMPVEFQMFVDEVKIHEDRQRLDQPGTQVLDVPFTPNQIKVDGKIQSAKIMLAPPPNYPALATQANIQGTVRVQVVIGLDGTATNVQLVRGPPLLAQSALDAVKNWTWQPTLVNGSAVTVLTTVDVPFTLQPIQ